MKNYYKCIGCGECIDASESHGKCTECGGTKWLAMTDRENLSPKTKKFNSRRDFFNNQLKNIVKFERESAKANLVVGKTKKQATKEKETI